MIDETLLPRVYLRTNGSYIDSVSGEVCKAPKIIRGETIVIYPSSKISCVYAKYHKNIDRLEVTTCTFRDDAANIGHWKPDSPSYFIDRNKNVYDEGGNVCSGPFIGKYYRTDSFFDYLSYSCRASFNAFADKEVVKFLGGKTPIVVFRSVRYANNFHDLSTWFDRGPIKKSVGKEQKLLNGLVEKKLTELSSIKHGFSPYCRYIYFEKITDTWSVLRFLDYTNDLFETERLYINQNGKVRPAVFTNSGWMAKREIQDLYERYHFINKDEAIKNCNRLKYVLPIAIEICDLDDIKHTIIKMLKFPVIEQIAKLGGHNIAVSIARSRSPLKDISYFFPRYNEKATSVSEKFGMNVHQLRYYSEKFDSKGINCVVNIINFMCRYFGKELVHIDNDSFDIIFTTLLKFDERNKLIDVEWLVKNVNVDPFKFLKNVARLLSKNSATLNLVVDAIKLLYLLPVGLRPEINWYFKDVSDVVRVHDALIAINNDVRQEQKRIQNLSYKEALKETDKKRRVYEYEDEQFIIRLPVDCDEIDEEGKKQHICIGGYVSNHARGHTTLLFLRRKNEPDTPFYAIELTNNSRIAQIHGFGNKWLGNNPEAIPTVVRWLRKHNIYCDEGILTCCSVGYGKTQSFIEMPVVD